MIYEVFFARIRICLLLGRGAEAIRNLAKKSHALGDLDGPDRRTKPVSVSIAVPSLKLLGSLMDAKTVLDSFGVHNEVSIVAAHWAPKKTLRFIAELESKGVEVIIAAADGSAHLPGMIASFTNIPVIGV